MLPTVAAFLRGSLGLDDPMDDPGMPGGAPAQPYDPSMDGYANTAPINPAPAIVPPPTMQPAPALPSAYGDAGDEPGGTTNSDISRHLAPSSPSTPVQNGLTLLRDPGDTGTQHGPAVVAPSQAEAEEDARSAAQRPTRDEIDRASVAGLAPGQTLRTAPGTGALPVGQQGAEAIATRGWQAGTADLIPTTPQGVGRHLASVAAAAPVAGPGAVIAGPVIAAVQAAQQAGGNELGRQVARALGVTDEQLFTFFGIPVSGEDIAGFVGENLTDPSNVVGGPSVANAATRFAGRVLANPAGRAAVGGTLGAATGLATGQDLETTGKLAAGGAAVLTGALSVKPALRAAGRVGRGLAEEAGRQMLDLTPMPSMMPRGGGGVPSGRPWQVYSREGDLLHEASSREEATAWARQHARGADIVPPSRPIDPSAVRGAPIEGRAAPVRPVAPEGEYPYVGDTVDGLTIRPDVPNVASIGATFDDYAVLPGVREVPIADLGAPQQYANAAENRRVERLAAEIRASGEIAPLIVVRDGDGLYVLEGGHRLSALQANGAQSVPAIVVVDKSATAPTQPGLLDRARGALERNAERVADADARMAEQGGTMAPASLGGLPERARPWLDRLDAIKARLDDADAALARAEETGDPTALRQANRAYSAVRREYDNAAQAVERMRDAQRARSARMDEAGYGRPMEQADTLARESDAAAGDRVVRDSLPPRTVDDAPRGGSVSLNGVFGMMPEDPVARSAAGPVARPQVRPDAGDIEARATQHFGTTESPRETGYILRDGSGLDFSGRQYGGPGYSREMDHREIGAITERGGTEGMLQFMSDTGAVRFSNHGKDIVVDIPGGLSPKQKARLLEEGRYSEFAGIDITDPKTGQTVASHEFTFPRDRAAFNRLIRSLPDHVVDEPTAAQAEKIAKSESIEMLKSRIWFAEDVLNGKQGPVDGVARSYYAESLQKDRAALRALEGGMNASAGALPSSPTLGTRALDTATRVLGEGLAGGTGGAVIEQGLNPDDPDAARRGFIKGAVGFPLATRGARALPRLLGRGGDDAAEGALGVLGSIPGMGPIDRRWQQAAARAAAQAAAARAAGKAPPPTAGDWLRSIGYSGMIGPSTGIVNALGNGLELVYHLPKDIVRSIGRGNLREAGAEARGLVTGFMRSGGEILDALAGAHPGGGVENARLSQRVQNPLGQLAAQLIESPTRIFSEVPDAFYRSIATSMGESRQAAQIATNEGLTGAAWSQRVGDLLNDVATHRAGGGASPEVVRIIKDGHDLAERLTLRGEIGPRGQAFKAGIDALPFGLGNLVMPFFNTPYHMLQRQLERSPVGLAMKTQPAKFDKYYDAILGTGVAAGVGGLAMSGAITGSGPDDAEKRRMLQTQGWQANSTLVGGRWIPNNTFGVFGPMLDTAGELGDAVRYQKKDAANRDIGGELVRRTLAVVGNQVYLRGIGDIMQAAKDPAAYGESYVAQTLSRGIPLGATARLAGTMTDPNERAVEKGGDVGSVEAVRQRVARGLPGQGLPVIGGREGLAVAQDVLGRPVENARTGVAALGPRMRTPKPDPIIEAYTTAGIDIGNPPSSFTEEGVKIEMTPEQQRDYQRYMGEHIIKGFDRANGSSDRRRTPQLQALYDEAREKAQARIRADIGRSEIRNRVRTGTGR